MFPTITHTTSPDCELSQFILPDLINDCHYPLRQNPHRDAVSRASDQWLIDVAQLIEHELKGYIKMDSGRFVAILYPDADAFHLRVFCDFMNWIFILDDRMEHGVIDVQETCESCISALRDPTNFDTEQLGAKMCKSYDHFFASPTLFLKVVMRSGFSAASGKLLAPAAQRGLSTQASCSSLLWQSRWTTVPREICMIYNPISP